MVRVSATTNRVLNVIEEYWSQHQTAPTVREVCQLAGCSSTSIAHYHVMLLVRLGRLTPKWVPPPTRCAELLSARQC